MADMIVSWDKFKTARQVAATNAAQTNVDLSGTGGIRRLWVQLGAAPGNVLRVSVTVGGAGNPVIGTDPDVLDATGVCLRSAGDYFVMADVPITGFHVYNSHSSAVNIMLNALGD
jgi:hypothetical protein